MQRREATSDTVRPARIQDVGALDELMALSLRTLGAADYSAEQIESALRASMGIDRQLVKDKTYYVIERQGRVVAAGGWSFRGKMGGGERCAIGDSTELLSPEVSPAVLRLFFVHPTHVRRGLGGRLVALCERAAARHGFAAMELAATLCGMPLFRACGYGVLDRWDLELPDGMSFPVVWMYKTMTGAESRAH